MIMNQLESMATKLMEQDDAISATVSSNCRTHFSNHHSFFFFFFLESYLSQNEDNSFKCKRDSGQRFMVSHILPTYENSAKLIDEIFSVRSDLEGKTRFFNFYRTFDEQKTKINADEIFQSNNCVQPRNVRPLIVNLYFSIRH